MLIYEYKIDANKEQLQAIENAIRIAQFIRNKCIRLWMDEHGVSNNDLQVYCSTLASQYDFADCLNSQARQSSADRAWVSISRFYDTCKNKKPGKKGYPKFQHDNRSVEYKQTGWKLEPDGRHITFTDKSRKHSKCEKSSSNRKKAQKKLAKAHLKVQRQREDFARKTANALITSSDVIAYEKLSIKNMVKNHHLAKSISDASWGKFLAWVNYYGTIHSVPVIAVVPNFTSQDCSACGTRVEKSLSVRTHVCHSCGLVMDRDHNAALNILEKAHRTVGHTATGRADGALRNASGQKAATRVSKGISGKSSGRKKNSPSL